MIASIAACLAAFVGLVWLLRRDRTSLGLPIAYLFALLLIHVPGAFAHLMGAHVLSDTDLTELGIGYTAIGAVCFVVGVAAARFPGLGRVPAKVTGTQQRFWLFCLIGGWFFVYGLSFARGIPSVGAAIERGGAVWMLGVMLGLQAALRRGEPLPAALWLSALAVFPALTFIVGGFLSYGSTAIIIVLSALAVSARSHWRVAAGIAAAAILAINMFLSYFQNRADLREAVWSGAPLEERVDVSMNMVRDFEWFNPANERHLDYLDQRLNQNYFVGLAAARIQDGHADYLHGRSIWEGLAALVPRVLWEDKPVFAGSPGIVSEMTGLNLSETTSFGVGNVMEFHINFGVPGLVVGFLLLGWLLGTLDRGAALAERSGDAGRLLCFFLPAVALIQPNGSVVELASGSAAALVAALGWNWAWNYWAADPASLPARAAR